MAYYIKVNQKVASFVGLDKYRKKLSDGNYILWQGDLTKFGSLEEMDDIIKKIGGVALSDAEAKKEVEDISHVKLPMPTDKRFII